VFDSAPSGSQGASLSGSGIAAVTTTPGTLVFGNQFLGIKGLALTVTVKNNKTTVVTITGIASNLSDYSFTTTCPLSPSTLAGSGSCTISVYFKPTALGSRTGTLTVSTNAGANPTVKLIGTGILPAAVSPGSLSFASQALGTTSAAQAVTLTNNQKKTLKITGVTASPPDFAGTTTCPLSPNTLAAGASCTSSVTFSPKATGTRSGTLTFTDDATNSPQTVSLTGVGNPAALASIALTPQNPSVTAGLTQHFSATGTYTEGSTQDLTAIAIWTSSSTAVAAINAAGLATASVQGTTTITAASGSITGSTTLTVTAPQLKSIAVTPANPSLAKGTSQQLTATGTYSDGSTLDITRVVTWSSGSPAIATVDGSGLATSVAVGSTVVTATSGSVSGSTNLTVTAAALVSIAVTPAIPSLPLGMQQQFTATGTYTDATTQDISATVTWSSSQTSVATITAQGLASAAAIGNSTVSAKLGSVQGSTTLTVTAAVLVSIAVSPASPSIPLGTAQQFAATGTFSDNTSQDLTPSVVWSADSPAVVTIAAGGLATSASVGSSAVTATSGSVTGSAMLTVTPAQLVSVAVTPGTATVAAGVSQQFTASGTFTDGSVQDVTLTGHWSSSNASVATVSNTPGSQGLTSTSTTGTSTITISSGGVSGSGTLNVTAAALVSITITPQAATIAEGQTQQFAANGTYTDGSTQDITAVVTWSSANAGVAIISNSAGTNGLATSAGPGTTTITAALDAISGSTTLTVSTPVAVSLAISPVNPAVPFGGLQQFAVTATLSNGSTQDVSAQATWLSSTPAVASVNSTGGATGVGAGVSTITASYSGLTSSTQLTVAAPVLVSLSITPANPTLVVGTLQQLTATGTYSNGGTADLTNQVQWTSDTPATATVNAGGSVTAVAVGSTVVTAGVGSIIATVTVTVSQASLVSIAVTPANTSLAKGTSEQMTAIGTYSDGSTVDITASVAWTTADPGTASVNSSGLATSLGIGSTTVTATLGGISGSTNLTVTAAALVSIAVTPAVPNLPLGMQQQFTATGTYTDGTTTGLGTGAATISATSGSITGATTLTVTAAVLVSISVLPAAPSIALGTTQQFSALGSFSDGTSQDLTATVAWSSDTTAVATISVSGLASSTGTGPATVTATSGNISGSAVLTVTPAQLVSIALNPPSATVAAGTTQQFTALGSFTDGSTQDVTASGHWSSSNPGAATVSDTPGSQGLASTLSPGSTTITMSEGGVTVTATLNVTAAALVSIAITPQSPSINAGTSQQFTASGTYTDKSVQDITAMVTWSSSSAAVAIISNNAGSNGLATSAGPGTTTISATLGTVSASTTLTVNGIGPISLAISPLNPAIFTGGLQQFVATATLSDGTPQDVTTQASWSSSMPAVASVSATGIAAGVGPGIATITATYSGLSSSTSLSVAAPVLVSLSLTPANPTVTLGTSQQLSATGTYSNGSTFDVTAQAQWISANVAAAAVNAQGMVTGVAAGTTSITASIGVISASTMVTVSSAIQHVMIIIKQNHSFDNYFGTDPGADGATAGPISTGQAIVFPHGSDAVRAEVGHDRSSYLSAIDGGRMDRFDIIASGNINGEYNAFGQLVQSDMPNYWTYASNFVLADRMFSSQVTAGFANQLVYIAGTAGGVIDNPLNTSPGLPPKWGCDSDPGGTVPVMDSSGVISKVFPCFDFTTIADSLMNAGLTWRFYGALAGQLASEWSAFDAISHIRNSPLWTSNVISEDQFATDAAAGNLPTVTWLIASKGSEHPKASSCVGENWTVQQINAIMQGPLWNSTAIFVTWDEAGAFFDHVVPPNRAGTVQPR